MPLEIERKFLLKRVPDIKWNTTYEMQQYYCQEPKLRVRHTFDLKTKAELFIQTKKTRLKPGVYEEDEKIISSTRFFNLRDKSDKVIRKRRYIKVFPKLKWEIDEFLNSQLVVAEVELPTENYRLTIPKFIQDLLIMEVTEFSQFTNISLAENYPFKYERPFTL